MADFKCLVVCEGSSDFAIIEGLFEHVSSETGKEFEIVLTEPQLDATGKKHQKFGYEGVKSWCLHKKHKYEQQGVDFIGSMMTLSQADCLLIHLDTDIAERVSCSSDANVYNGTGDRRSWCHAAVDYWFGAVKDGQNIIYLLPTYQIESWILATHDLEPPETNYERINDAEARMVAMGYKEDNTKPGRLYKEYTLYQKHPDYLNRLIAEIDVASGRCPELSEIINYLEGR